MTNSVALFLKLCSFFISTVIAMTEDPRALASVQPDWSGEAHEAFFHAKFVCAAYTMGEALMTDPPPPLPTLPDGFEFVADVYMTDFVFAPDAQPTHYGLLAAKGTRFVLAIRGTVGWKEWWADLTSLHLVDCVFRNSATVYGQVGDGFLRLYNTLQIVRRSADTPAEKSMAPAPQQGASFADAVHAVIASHLARSASRTPGTAADERAPTVDVVGHSLGSALATLYALDNNDKPDYYPTRRIVTFASPMVGNRTFVNDFTTKFPNVDPRPSLRFYISSDVVPTVPPTWLGFAHVDQGVELKLGWSTSWWWPPCSHSLSSYMHVLSLHIDEPDKIWPLPSACTGSSGQDRCSPPGKAESAVA